MRQSTPTDDPGLLAHQLREVRAELERRAAEHGELLAKYLRLEEAHEQLQELDRLKSGFLGTLSHELRTPLTSIIGYSEMLIAGIGGALLDEQRDFVAIIHERGQQLLELIRGLLDFSKLESGTTTLRKSDVSIERVVADVEQTLAPLGLRRGVRLTSRVESGLPRVWADAERLSQVLRNLVENAIKFTPQGGEVTVTARPTLSEAPPMVQGPDAAPVIPGPRRRALELRVADTGIGIPDGERSRVFAAFYQVDCAPVREHSGAGLGLSIVKRLVEAHGGAVRIESNATRGTVFVVTIPCRQTIP